MEIDNELAVRTLDWINSEGHVEVDPDGVVRGKSSLDLSPLGITPQVLDGLAALRHLVGPVNVKGCRGPRYITTASGDRIANVARMMRELERFHRQPLSGPVCAEFDQIIVRYRDLGLPCETCNARAVTIGRSWGQGSIKLIARCREHAPGDIS